MVFGDVEGGRLKAEEYVPVIICRNDVVFDGLAAHSPSHFNGDRWSLVLFTHASWATVSQNLVDQIRDLGLDCPDAFYDVVPAEDVG